MPKMDENEMWVQWTHDAMNRYIMPDDIEDSDELADDMTEIATKYADSMLDEYAKRFRSDGRTAQPSKRRSRHEPEES